MKSLTRRVLALFLALTMVLDMAMPVWAEEVNGTDNQASQVVTCVEDDCDCCDHEHEHEHEHIEASEGLVVTNPEEKVEEPEKEEKGFFEKIGEEISNLVSNIAKVVAPEKEEVEEPEEIEEELEEEEVEILDTEIPAAFAAPVMAASRVMMLGAGAGAPTPKDTTWAEGRPSAAHTNCVYEANLNDCTAQVSCKYDGFMHWINCGGTTRYFTTHNFPERSGCEEETVECTRCYQTHTYPEEHEFPARTSCAAQTVTCTRCNNETYTYPAVNHTYTKNQVEEKAGDDASHYIYCDTCHQITTVAHKYQSVQTYDCAKHKYVCRDCGHVKYENHTWGNNNKCTACKISKNSNHNYVFDVNGTITYEYHTLKCTGCGKTNTEEHDLTRGEDDDCTVCGVHQYYNPSKRASHRYIVNNSDCTQSVYCLATLYPKNSSEYCSEPERLFNRGSHEYEYTNIKETTHDKSCKYCTIETVTEDHDYSITRNGKKYCICGKEEPPCEHEYEYTKINDTKHKYECKLCGQDGEENHSWDNGVVTQPTCTSKGYTTYTCTKCKATKVGNETNKIPHNFEDEWEVVTPATCTADGLEKRVCTICKEETQTRPIKSQGHKAGEKKIENRVESTCKEKGHYDEVVYCSVCNTELSRETKYLELASHTEGQPVRENVKDSTCTAEGSYDEVVYCSVCNTELSRDKKTIDKKAHTRGEAERENIVNSTCEEDGSYDLVVRCTVCDEPLETTPMTIGKLGHDYNKVVTDPTCLDGGYTTYTCKREGCNHSYTADETDALGHDWDNGTQTLDPTCTEEGNMHFECSRCEATKDEDIDALGHLHRTVDKKDATCLEDGYTEGDYCDRCQQYISGHKVIKAEGHKVSILAAIIATCTGKGKTQGEVCSVCGATLKAQEETPATGHKWGEWKVTTDPTCTEAGVETRVCKADRRHTDTRPVEALGHKPANAVRENVVEATCTKEGSYDEVVYCSVCKIELSRTPKTIEKKDHTVQIKMGRLATCLEDGYTSYEECAVCHTHLTEPRELKALGHDFEHGTEVAREDSTCLDEGYYRMKCIRCEETQDFTIDSKGHIEVPMMTKMATCETDGEKGGVKCSRCNNVLVTPTVIPAHGHDYGEWTVTTPSTCFEEGVETRVCIHDKRHTETRPVEKARHNFVKVKGSDSYEQIEGNYKEHKHVWTEACTNEGCTETRTCDELLSHHFEDGHVDATCTTKGYDYRTCSDCGYYYERNKNDYPARGHDFTSEKAVELKKVEPTCTEDGYKVMKCSRCDVQDTITLTKLGHDYKKVEGSDTYVPFNEESHNHKWDQKCERCNKLQHVSQVQKCTADEPVIENRVEATCAKEGSYEEVTYCVDCKQELSRETKIIPIDKDAHAYGEWYRWIEPTCEEFGYMRRDCANTNAHYETQAIGALGHDTENATWQVKTKAGNETEGLEVLICGRDNCEKELETRTIHERNITAESNTVTYNGTNQAGAIVPSEGGYSVEIRKGNDKVNEAVNAGTYKLSFTFPENEKYNKIVVEAVLTISPAKITPDDVNFAEELQALMDKNIDKDYDGTNTVLFDEDDEMTINVNGVKIKVTGTFANELPGENKSADILLAIQDENNNYVFANNETQMPLEKQGNINVIKLADTFGDINLANNVTDKKEVSKEIDKKLDKSHRDIKDFKFNDAKISDGEYDIPEVTAYGTKLPASVTFTATVKDDEGKEVVIIEKKVTGTVTYNYSSSKKKKKKTDEELIDPTQTPYGLDFEYIDLPKNLETPSDWAKDDIYDLTYKGIVNGYEDQTYRPNNLIRRDEFAKLAYLVLSLKEDENGRSKDFEDTKGNWAEEMIRIATTVDVLRGYDDTFFGPADSITNEQMMAILVRGLKYLGKDLRIDNDKDAEEALKAVVDGAEVSDWAKYDAATAVKYGLFIGNENKEIKPLGYTTRAQVAVILERYMNLVADLLK